ncbi:hypothetical protein [Yoonia sp.]|uniref:hypothetical protein n=1 Tax=Yoonia sp. TaxID=2212373 RepID=UPI0019EF68D9|nr:hypothetical protein [Yoonia sp.]MBE0414119.1 hypothetical protein [Yoonia sp.]
MPGRVAEIDHDAGFGQVMATDHRLICFHENAVVYGSFAALRLDDTVDLAAQTEESGIGPQASTVRKIGGSRFDPAVKK